MKKLVITLLMLAAPAVTFAQLKVLSDGSTQAGAIADNDAQLVSGAIPTGSKHIAILGTSELQQGYSVGVLGNTQGNSSGMAYGVAGCVMNNANGAGVYGSSTGTMAALPYHFAGYFNGTTYMNGTSFTYSLNNISDARLTKDVSLMSAKKRVRETLDNVLEMDVLEYTFKEREMEAYEKDENGNIVKRRIVQEPVDNKLHFGLSAQELQKVYPNLVTEGADGSLSINYIELVPVLIQAIQELKQELDDVKGENGQSARKLVNTTRITDTQAKGNVLYQNSPNPFKEQTTIRFQLADEAQNAAICIFDMTGKMLKKLPVSVGMESVSVAGHELGEGMFLYSLIVNGKEIDTKRMIVTN